MASQAMQRLQHFNSQNISNTLWAFASLNHHPGPMLLKVLQRELVHKLRQFTPQGIENVLWAFATLGHHPGMPALPCPLYSTTTTFWRKQHKTSQPQLSFAVRQSCQVLHIPLYTSSFTSMMRSCTATTSCHRSIQNCFIVCLQVMMSLLLPPPMYTASCTSSTSRIWHSLCGLLPSWPGAHLLTCCLMLPVWQWLHFTPATVKIFPTHCGPLPPLASCLKLACWRYAAAHVAVSTTICRCQLFMTHLYCALNST